MSAPPDAASITNAIGHDRLLAASPTVNLGLVMNAGLTVLTVAIGGMAFRMVAYRAIGPSESGLLALSLSIVTLASSFITIGIPVAVVKFVAARDSARQAAAIILTGLRLVTFHAVIVGIAIVCLLPAIANTQTTTMRLEITACAVMGAYLAYWERVYNGMLDMKSTTVINFANNFCRLALLVALIVIGAVTVRHILVVLIIAGAIANIWGTTLAVRLFRQYRHEARFERNHAKQLYRFGIPQFGAVLLDQVNYNMGVLITAHYLTAADVGIYSAAALIAGTLWLAPSALQMLTYPLMAEAWRKADATAIATIVGFTVRVSAVLFTAMTYAVLCLRTDLISLIFGQDFLSAQTPLVILAGGYWCNAVLSRPLGASMGAVDRPAFDVARVGIAMAVNLLCTIAWVPRYGIEGAAWAMAIGLVVTSLISHALILKFCRVPIEWSTIKSLLLVVPALLLLFIPASDVVLRAMLTAAGSVLLLALGWYTCLTPNDRQLIQMRCRRGERWATTQAR